VCSDSVVYSFGTGEDVSFDLEVIKRHGCYVHAFDPTPKSIQWVRRRKLPEKFIFHEFGLGTSNGHQTMYLPMNEEHVSGSLLEHSGVNLHNTVDVELRTLDSVVRQLGHDRIDVLKMDIEGAEYEVLEQFHELDIPVVQLLVEFHERFTGDAGRRTMKTVDSLQAAGFRISGVSDSLQEVSFVYRDYIDG
jgi:FkbM family methyltransferase